MRRHAVGFGVGARREGVREGVGEPDRHPAPPAVGVGEHHPAALPGQLLELGGREVRQVAEGAAAVEEAGGDEGRDGEAVAGDDEGAVDGSARTTGTRAADGRTARGDAATGRRCCWSSGTSGRSTFCPAGRRSRPAGGPGRPRPRRGSARATCRANSSYRVSLRTRTWLAPRYRASADRAPSGSWPRFRGTSVPAIRLAAGSRRSRPPARGRPRCGGTATGRCRRGCASPSGSCPRPPRAPRRPGSTPAWR